MCVSKKSKVTRAKKTLSFAGLIIGGNGNGVAGYGYGRGKTVESAMLDAERKLHQNLFVLPLYENYTIFHAVTGYFKRTVCVIRPAPDGRGLAGGKLSHGIMSCFGIRDACSKFFGSKNIYNRTKAVFNGLSLVRSAEEFAMSRGRKLWELNRKWIDRPARFTDYQMTEKQRMKLEADEHSHRFRHVRKILKDYGRDHLDIINTPAGLYTTMLRVESERKGAGVDVSWREESGLPEDSVEKLMYVNRSLLSANDVKDMDREDFFVSREDSSESPENEEQEL